MSELLEKICESIQSGGDATQSVAEIAFGMKTKLLKRRRKDPKKSRMAKKMSRKPSVKRARLLALRKFRKSSKGKAQMKKLARFNRGKPRMSSLTVKSTPIFQELHELMLECTSLMQAYSEYQFESVQEDITDKTEDNREFPEMEIALCEINDLAELVVDISSVLFNGFNETEDADDVDGLKQDAIDFLSDYSSDETDAS